MVEGFINYPDDYQLKYRWRGKSENGTGYGLNIYVDTKAHIYIDEDPPVITAQDFEGLVSIQLEVQGGSEAVTAPIVKTQMRFSLVDAPDMSDENYKRGDWIELFTPEATKYLVELVVFPIPGNTTTATTIWQGFITPDSWEEELRYHGIITITARDNLGHLADFDANIFERGRYDLMCVSDAIRWFLAILQFPMDYEIPYDYTGAPHLNDGVEWLLDSSFHISRAEDKKADELLEELLEATGYCLRWSGNAKYVLVPIRNLPLLNLTSRPSSSNIHTIHFYGGTKIMDPAYKSITESVKYEGSNELELDIWRAFKDTSNHMETYTGRFYDTEDQEWKTFYGRSVRNSGTGRDIGGWAYGMGFMNAGCCSVQSTLANEDGPDAMSQGINLAANFASGQELDMTYRLACLCTDITLKFKFARPVELKTSSIVFTVARLKSYMYQAQLYIKYTSPSGVDYYWTGSAWSTTQALVTVSIATEMSNEYEFSIVLQDISANGVALGGDLSIIFHNLICRGEDTPDYGVFCRLTELKVLMNKSTRLTKNTVSTINNSDYNLEEKRKPALSVLSMEQTLVHPLNYPNILYKYDTSGKPVPFGYNVRYRETENLRPLPGQIHKQILCFSHEVLSILEGDFGKVSRDAIYNPGLFKYKDKIYLLHGGTFDILRDRITSGQLREFFWYDDLWEDSVSATISATSASTSIIHQALIDSGISEDTASALASGETVTLTALEQERMNSALESIGETATVTTIERSVSEETMAFERQTTEAVRAD